MAGAYGLGRRADYAHPRGIRPDVVSQAWLPDNPRFAGEAAFASDVEVGALRAANAARDERYKRRNGEWREPL